MKALLLSKFGKGRGAKAVAGEAELRKKFSRIRFARFGRGSRCTVELTSAEAKQRGRALAKLPADMVAKLNTACNEVLGMPDIKRRLIELGITAVPTSTASFVTFVKDQVAVLGPAVKGAGVKL